MIIQWLQFIELTRHDDVQELTTELLKSYVLTKHNGHVTRLNQGRQAEVLSQVERIVASAALSRAIMQFYAQTPYVAIELDDG